MEIHGKSQIGIVDLFYGAMNQRLIEIEDESDGWSIRILGRQSVRRTERHNVLVIGQRFDKGIGIEFFFVFDLGSLRGGVVGFHDHCIVLWDLGFVVVWAVVLYFLLVVFRYHFQFCPFRFVLAFSAPQKIQHRTKDRIDHVGGPLDSIGGSFLFGANRGTSRVHRTQLRSIQGRGGSRHHGGADTSRFDRCGSLWSIRALVIIFSQGSRRDVGCGSERVLQSRLVHAGPRALGTRDGSVHVGIVVPSRSSARSSGSSRRVHHDVVWCSVVFCGVVRQSGAEWSGVELS
mmetsp:Transcript_9193/g.22333  ORF Transcript_9193/g.22333 Transcript_9193/m.22333 type:complete len:289 (+) Transcript_9193:3230-4096(+)